MGAIKQGVLMKNLLQIILLLSCIGTSFASITLNKGDELNIQINGCEMDEFGALKIDFHKGMAKAVCEPITCFSRYVPEKDLFIVERMQVETAANGSSQRSFYEQLGTYQPNKKATWNETEKRRNDILEFLRTSPVCRKVHFRGLRKEYIVTREL
jgi:hypothetical protein